MPGHRLPKGPVESLYLFVSHTSRRGRAAAACRPAPVFCNLDASSSYVIALFGTCAATRDIVDEQRGQAGTLRRHGPYDYIYNVKQAMRMGTGPDAIAVSDSAPWRFV